MQVPQALRALNHRDYRLFWCGQLISLIGSWMQTVGQSWLVLELTNSPFKLGLISTLQFAPMLLLSLVAGAMIDRLPKRKVIIATQTGLTVLAFVLSALVWTKAVQFWHVAVLAALLGLINTFDLPARQAFLVDMVGKPDLMNAVGLNSAIFNAARVVGPAVGGILVGHNIALAFFFNGVSFLPVIGALLAIRVEGAPGPQRQRSMAAEIGAGLRFAWRTPRLQLLLGLVFGISTFVLNWNVLVPLLAKQVLHRDAAGFGALMSALGVGALGGALFLTARSNREQPISAVLIPGVVVAVAAVLVSFVHGMGLAAGILFVIGFAQPTFMGGCNTLIQMTAPDELRGRVMSLYNLVATGSTPLGSMLMGTVTAAYGASSGFLTGGLLGLASVAALLLWWRGVQARQRRPGAVVGG